MVNLTKKQSKNRYPPKRMGLGDRAYSLGDLCSAPSPEDDCDVWENGHGALAAPTSTSFHFWQNLHLQRLDCLFI